MTIALHSPGVRVFTINWMKFDSLWGFFFVKETKRFSCAANVDKINSKLEETDGINIS